MQLQRSHTTSSGRVATGCPRFAHRALVSAPRRPRSKLPAVATETVVAQLGGSVVNVQVEKTSWNSRKLYASVNINAPVSLVWNCLTDYEGLSSFIPSLVENRCLQQKSNGAVVYQVGAQDVAMGVKFSAACTLDCTEYPEGVPTALCSTSGDGSDGLLPHPRTSAPGLPARDISFVLVEGDFKAFRGVWRMQPSKAGSSSGSSSSQSSAGGSFASGDEETGSGSGSGSQQQGAQGDGCLLCYSLYVMPQAWLPVGLIQSRIEKEVMNNLEAIRRHAEKLHKSGQGRGQQQRGAASSTSSSLESVGSA